jgi:hypothetical protein
LNISDVFSEALSKIHHIFYANIQLYDKISVSSCRRRAAGSRPNAAKNDKKRPGILI